MRMWMLPPEWMCSKHIRGEHGEIHKFRHTFEKGHSIRGRLDPVVQIEPLAMKARHDKLAQYLQSHSSPYEMPDLSAYPEEQITPAVDPWRSFIDLWSRCPECRRLMAHIDLRHYIYLDDTGKKPYFEIPFYLVINL